MNVDSSGDQPMDGEETGEVEIHVGPPESRAYYSVDLISAASFFARLAQHVEATGRQILSTSPLMEHRSYVSACIFSTVAFLEATINEVCSDAAEGLHTQLRGFDEETERAIGGLWKLDVPRTAQFNIMRKYQIVVTAAKRQALDVGARPAQDVAKLIKLRNTLIHFEPEWIFGGSPEEADNLPKHKLELEFSGRFSLNPLTPPGVPFFPDRLLSAGCATWAVTSSMDFVDIFFARLGLEPQYHDVRQYLALG